MLRIFSLLSAFMVLLVLIAGGGTYWVSQADIAVAKHKSAKASAQGMALSISSQVKTLQQTVLKMAVVPEVVVALENGEPALLAQTALQLEQYMPELMKIRVLPAHVSDLDQTSIPHMGNADLIMAQESLVKPQHPVIQGQGVNRHLAITAVVKSNDVAIGVILASLKFDFLQSTLKQYKNSSELGFFELNQDKISLAKAGDIASKVGSDNNIQVPQTVWNINYWPTNASDLNSISLIAAIVFTPVLLVFLAFFIVYRKITANLRQDQGSILKVVKDLMSGKTVGSYPVHLNEMKAIISTIVQFKRVLDHGEGIPASDNADTEIDDFFDEPSGMSFLDIDSTEENAPTTSIESKPISLPNTGSTSETSSFTQEPASEASSPASIFKAYDIRGIAGKTLTKEIAFNIGRAIASEAKEKNIKTIVLGRDGRTSSSSLAESVAKGIITTGVNVLDIGLVPSPVVYFVAQHTEGKSGVIITGSHNPADYNGVKIVINGESIAGDKIQLLKQRIDSDNYLTGEDGSIEKNSMFNNEYIGMISEDIHIARPMKVVVDCGNGAAGELAPVLLKTLGCEVIELFCDIDGTFPNHHPDPSKPENLNDLITAVKHYEADVGIAFDGDGDRLGVIDAKGRIIWPDRQMMLFAKDVLAMKPGAEVIYDVKSSRHLKDQIVKSGGRPLMARTGHSFMKAKIKETGAVLAGEHSGHIFFNDRWFGFDDALYSASRLIEILSTDTRNSDEVFADFPDSVNTPEINIEVAEGENISLMKQLIKAANFTDGKIIDIDGMRVEFPDGWGIVRASNTLPVLSLRFEADNKAALQRIQSEFKALLSKVKPNLNIPF